MLLPVALFVGMGVVVIAALWRIFVVGGEARRTAQGLRVALDVAHRADVCLTDLALQFDALRHHRLDPDAASGDVEAALDRMRAIVAEGHALPERNSSKAVCSLVEERDRALRSLELIDHGRGLLALRDGDPGEGETAVKRGYLNLVHARDSIREREKEVRGESAPGSAMRATERR